MADAIITEQLVKTFGRTRALDGLTFTVGDGRGARLPRPERRRQDDDAAHPAGAGAGRRRAGHGCSAATRGATRSRCTGAWPTCPATSRCGRTSPGGEVIDLLGPPARRPRREAAGGAARALRPRPDQEGPHLLEGQPPEGRAGRRARLRRRAAAARRADVRSGPADGGGVSRVHRRRARQRPHRAAVEPHPRRGRGAVRPT